MTAGARLAVVAAALAMVLGGCISEAAGSQVWGVNESDQDVIVFSPVHGASYVLPARTWGKLFDAYRAPDGDIVVFDADCQPIATLPLRTPLATVHVPPAGAPELAGDDPGTVPAGLAAGRADTPAFEPKACPS